MPLHKTRPNSTIPLDILNDVPNLLLKEDALDLCHAIKNSGDRPSLVVVDTLAQSMAGANENASEDMGKALAHCKGIHKATGAMVLLIHHSGKDSSKGARGWSGMRAAADVELEVSRTLTGRILRTTKQKDGADFQRWGFDLEVVAIGEDQDGDVVTSCVCVEAEVPATETAEGKEVGITRAHNQRAIQNAISEIALTQTAGVEIKAVIEMAMREFADLEQKAKESKAKNLDTVIKKLAKTANLFVLEEDKTITIL